MLRIGHGYDVHKLIEGRDFILGGVKIPYSKGLLGHSDADVLIHAVMDALLGAAALGDIGKLFPDTNKKFKGAKSTELLRKVCSLIADNGFTIQNIDSTVLAQEPKLSPYIKTMRENISHCCNLKPEQVSIKATTEENLGFTGHKEGIAAHAVCLISKNQLFHLISKSEENL